MVAQQVAQVAPQAIDRPGHHHVELALAGVVQHGVEARPLVPALRPADPLVLVDFDHHPLAQLGNLAQLRHLALDRLLVGGGHAHVDRRALRGPAHRGVPREMQGSPYPKTVQLSLDKRTEIDAPQRPILQGFRRAFSGDDFVQAHDRSPSGCQRPCRSICVAAVNPNLFRFCRHTLLAVLRQSGFSPTCRRHSAHSRLRISELTCRP